MSRTSIYLFRVLWVVALIIVTCLATMNLKHSVAQDINDKVGHIMAFWGLAFLSDFSFPKRKFDSVKILGLIGYGVLIEMIQYFIPYRECSFLDLLADGFGLLLYGMALPVIKQLPLLDQRWKNHNKLNPFNR